MLFDTLFTETKHALIASQVLGYQVGYAPGWASVDHLGEWHTHMGYFIMSAAGSKLPVPDYTTSLDAAWSIIDHIKQPAYPETCLVRDRFASFLDAHIGWWALRRTQLCDVICRCALRAFDVIDSDGRLLVEPPTYVTLTPHEPSYKPQ